jgi:hypothetical protein
LAKDVDGLGTICCSLVSLILKEFFEECFTKFQKYSRNILPKVVTKQASVTCAMSFALCGSL